MLGVQGRRRLASSLAMASHRGRTGGSLGSAVESLKPGRPRFRFQLWAPGEATPFLHGSVSPFLQWGSQSLLCTVTVVLREDNGKGHPRVAGPDWVAAITFVVSIEPPVSPTCTSVSPSLAHGPFLFVFFFFNLFIFIIDKQCCQDKIHVSHNSPI